MTCFSWILVGGGMIFILMSMIRWFEQVNEAVRNGWWNKTALLVLFPFSVWFFPSKVMAGRPTAVPRHEPVRGFGSLPKPKAEPAPSSAAQPTHTAEPAPAAPQQADQGPPPGTPAEWLVKPQIPRDKPKRPQAPIDPEKLAKLKQKMREQGMLDE